GSLHSPPGREVPAAPFARSSAQLPILVLYARHVDGARTGSQLVQDVVAAGVALPARDLGRLVVNRSEDDRLGRAGLLAGGHDLAVGDFAAGDARVDACALDALHAVGALLHDAAA